MKEVELSQLSEYIEEDLGWSPWFAICQKDVNRFADLTNDHQFIHVNPELAVKTPFGGTIAHGMFVVSLLSQFYAQTGIGIKSSVISINYGFDKIRFINPVAVNSEIRAQFKLVTLDDQKPGRIGLTFDVIVEIKGQKKPALIAQWLVMFYMA